MGNDRPKCSAPANAGTSTGATSNRMAVGYGFNGSAQRRHRSWSRALDAHLGVDDRPDLDVLYPRISLRESA